MTAAAPKDLAGLQRALCLARAKRVRLLAERARSGTGPAPRRISQPWRDPPAEPTRVRAVIGADVEAAAPRHRIGGRTVAAGVSLCLAGGLVAAGLARDNGLPQLPGMTAEAAAPIPRGAAAAVRVDVIGPDGPALRAIMSELDAVGAAYERRSGWAAPATIIRYFRPADARFAERLAARVGATALDFTSFRPIPAAARIEIWYAGE